MDKKTERYILNILREGTIGWSGRTECLKANRKQVVEGRSKEGKPVLKFYWFCNNCKEWFRNASEIEVDHIREVGSYTGDFHDYIRRMYCSSNNLQTLCIVCHKKKTSGFAANRKYSRKG